MAAQLIDDKAVAGLEEKILDECLNLVQRVQPELEKHFFYDVIPPWEDFKKHRMEELGHRINKNANP